MFEENHLFILKEALKISPIKYFKKYEQDLIKGIYAPDRFYGLLVIAHFYDPQYNKGIAIYFNAKRMGLRSFKKAIKLYKKGKKRKAHYFLAYSLHLLMDLAIPAHSKNIKHYFSSDDLEIYLKENIKKIKTKTNKAVSKKHINDYFVDIAKISKGLKCKKNNFWISLKFILTGKKDKLPEEELKKQSKKVLQLAISYSSGLIKRFFKEVN